VPLGPEVGIVIELFRYDGKRALVVGGATGMGAATAELVGGLGADVVVADFAPVEFAASEVVEVDLRDLASIDAAVAQIGDPIDALFACAGVADPAPRLMQVNFLGHRHLIESLVNRGLLPPGAAIGVISSTAGLGWEEDLARVGELLDTATFDEGSKWVNAHPDQADYAFSKKAMCAYVARQAYPFLRQGIRINAIQPGPTNTPLGRANAPIWFSYGREYREATGIELSRPEQQASILAFLCSPAASYITGISIVTDCGRTSARMLHGFPPPYKP
jgi:NAD(P)-dependent dehydrogenase (short-subunit alcohol dehydrogenase family)